MTEDAAWFRAAADCWRTFARRGNPAERQTRLEVADGFDLLAQRVEESVVRRAAGARGGPAARRLS